MYTKKALRFELSGRTAMFKKPDVNTYAYFSYNNIHKVALLGLLGAVLGLKGYGNTDSSDDFPEFYSKLKDLKVSIVPCAPKGYFTKKIQEFNNSVGYASYEQGGNLIVREQWLENPKWIIYLMNDGNVDEALYNTLERYILSGQAVFNPYLGKNDHPACISRSTLVDITKSDKNYINSLFINEAVKISDYDTCDGSERGFLFKEIAPYTMNREYNFYEFKEFIFTNFVIEKQVEENRLFDDGNMTLMFY